MHNENARERQNSEKLEKVCQFYKKPATFFDCFDRQALLLALLKSQGNSGLISSAVETDAEQVSSNKS